MLSEQEQIRRESLQKIIDYGINPYPAPEFKISHSSLQILENFNEGENVVIAGRLMRRKIQGKASFGTIQDYKGKIQIYFNRDIICPNEDKSMYNDVFKKWLDLGDIIGIEGKVFKTMVGETSVNAEKIHLLSKSLKPLPQPKIDAQGVTHDAFNDPELRYRRRYVDLVLNESVKETFLKRTKIINSMRNFLNQKEYLEVESPTIGIYQLGTNNLEKLEQIVKVEFKDIYFKYPNSDDYVLKNINFKLNAGMSLGIFGKTGAGKSSLVQLLCRLYEPSDGKIFINDISYQQLELNAYRKKIGYVPQDVFLFSDSIENNIAFGLNKEDFNEDEITTAAESAGLLNEIETFNDSFQTKIGERGITLSGGQKQRVSIARVLFRKPQLLIFDDCLSAVDSQTSKKIQHSLNKNSSKKISIHISHKINNISNCNHILVLENGEIVDQGNHESLLKSKGFYYDIFKKQQLEDN